MYATGAPTSLDDFLNSLATFAATAGWTVDHNAAFAGSDLWVALHKNSCYLHYYRPPSQTTDIQLYGATGYNSGAAPSAQPGVSPNPTLLHPAPAGPFTAYHFFSTNTGGVDYLHTMLEYSSGSFLHLHGGVLAPVGGLSNLIYTAGTAWSALIGGFGNFDGGPGVGNFWPFSAENSGGAKAITVLATIDSVTQWFAPSYVSPARLVGAIRSGSRNVHAFQRTPNTFNLLAPFIPLSLYAERAAGNIFAYIGDVIDMRFFNMSQNAAKDEITIGSDTWKVFPVIAKGPFLGDFIHPAATGNYGFGFRKNA